MFGLALKSDLDAARAEADEYCDLWVRTRTKDEELKRTIEWLRNENSDLADKVIELERRNENLFEALVGMTAALKNGCDININVNVEDQ